MGTSSAGVITHDYAEEMYLLDGELTDLTLGRRSRNDVPEELSFPRGRARH